ncbi:MAG: hypothetical protein JXR42_03660 [Gammaproteobacteria bacterium]|nr:hypothetical protein [Gammaproteobacteria bacterium]
MIKKIVVILLGFFVVSTCFGSISNNITWRIPNKKVMQELLLCQAKGLRKTLCVSNIMQKYDANQKAIAFTKTMQGRDFATKVKELGRNVSYIQTVEIGADHSSGAFLIDSTGKIINLNDYALLKQLNPLIWPKVYPNCQTMVSGNGKLMVVCRYDAKTCNACKAEGRIPVAFLFDKGGKFVKAVEAK